MAKLPSADDLGGLPAGGIPSGLPSGSASSLIAGYRALGAGIEEAGRGIIKAGLTIKANQDELELARAKSAYLLGTKEIDANPDAHNPEDYTGVGNAAADHISDPSLKEKFLRDLEPRVFESGHKMWQTKGAAALDETVQGLTAKIIQNPEVTESGLEELRTTIQQAQHAGIITLAQSRAYQKKTVAGLAAGVIARLATSDPDTLQAEIAGWQQGNLPPGTAEAGRPGTAPPRPPGKYDAFFRIMAENDPVGFIRIQQHAAIASDRLHAKQDAAMVAGVERIVLDAEVGKGELISRETIEMMPFHDEAKRNDALKLWGQANKNLRLLTVAGQKFQDGSQFNRHDPDEKKMGNLLWRRMTAANALDQAAAGEFGGPPMTESDLLNYFVSRTGFVPDAAADKLRLDLNSGEAGRIQNAATIAAGLLNKNPNIFDGIDGKDDIEKSAATFNYYLDRTDRDPEQAAELMLAERQRASELKIKDATDTTKIDKVIKAITPEDAVKAVTNSPGWIGRGFGSLPQLGFTPEMRSRLHSDYVGEVRRQLASTDDLALAQARAGAQLNKIWGVTTINNQPTVMLYAPEKAAAYARFGEDTTKLLQRAAIEDVKTELGVDVTPDQLMLTPVLRGHTAEAYRAGVPVPYTLHVRGQDGLWRTVSKSWYADPKRMDAYLVEERKQQFETRRGQTGPKPPVDQTLEESTAGRGTFRLDLGTYEPNLTVSPDVAKKYSDSVRERNRRTRENFSPENAAKARELYDTLGPRTLDARRRRDEKAAKTKSERDKRQGR